MRRGAREGDVDDNSVAECQLIPRASLDTKAEAASGESALDLVVDAQPELVLLDIGLPGMDGFQAAIAIRASAR